MVTTKAHLIAPKPDKVPNEILQARKSGAVVLPFGPSDRKEFPEDVTPVLPLAIYRRETDGKKAHYAAVIGTSIGLDGVVRGFLYDRDHRGTEVVIDNNGASELYEYELCWSPFSVNMQTRGFDVVAPAAGTSEDSEKIQALEARIASLEAALEKVLKPARRVRRKAT
jgi:hypothetical protein